MAIGDMPKKPVAKQTPRQATPSQKMFADAESPTARVNLYVKDPELLKELKIAALEDDTSLSALFEQWGHQWLMDRKHTRNNR